jgi:hypothetical protein
MAPSRVASSFSTSSITSFLQQRHGASAHGTAWGRCIYGVLAYAVMQRQREVGIRLALGARPGKAIGMFVYRGMMLSGIGIAIGVAVAAGITRWMSSLL